ncbi:MAG: hypothetical protein MJ198_06395 [Bacteroidales bacterium]|nr:hypothetical protein [Bacteroidales bacterium]
MGHGKETPRQKMIGMMYLFYTALMALNVSKDVLDSFIKINNSLNETNTNFISKNQIAYSAIEKAYLANPGKAQAIHDLSGILKQKADSLVAEMQYYKDTIIFYADKIDRSTCFMLPETGSTRLYVVNEEGDTVSLEAQCQSKDNLDIASQIMVGNDQGLSENCGGAKLKQSIINFREWVLGVAAQYGSDSTSITAKNINSSLNTNDAIGHEGGVQPWASAQFEHLPLMGAITVLTQWQSAVRNVEGDIVNLMYNQLDATSFKFNKLSPVILAPSTYIMQGNEYSSQIFLAAFDTTQALDVYVNGRKLPIDPASGLPVYKVNGGGIGAQKYNAVIKLPKPNSTDTLSYTISGEYQVAKPSLVVSPTKMNVFYIGPENPVEISVPGVPADKISASLTPSTHGSISKTSGGSYIVKVSRPGKCSIAVVADINGKKQNMGSVEFRIKTVPDPVAQVLGMNGGDIEKSRLQAAQTVDAKMKDFDFDLSFKVTSFTVSAQVGAYFLSETVKSNRINPQVKQNIFSKVSKGSKVYFEDIKAVGPDGKPRSLGVLKFVVK